MTARPPNACAAMRRCGAAAGVLQAPARRTRSPDPSAKPGSSALASSFASVESSALAAGAAASAEPAAMKPIDSSTSTACPTICALAAA